MPGKVINKMMGFFGLEDDFDENDEMNAEKFEDFSESETDPEAFITQSSKKRQNKVVNIHTAVSAKVIIVKPQDFDEATNICDDLKNRKIVVVNTTILESKVAQRLLDFMSGSSYALSAELQEIEKGIYILSPSNVEVSNELKNELSSKGIFNWNK
jgi:cell division inhibitor SepF